MGVEAIYRIFPPSITQVASAKMDGLDYVSSCDTLQSGICYHGNRTV